MEKIYSFDEIVNARTDLMLQEEIIKQYMKMVFKFTNKFNSKDIALMDEDDKVQIGMLSIVEAINTYNGSVSFKTHVGNCIRFGLMNERRKQCSTANFGVCVNANNGHYLPALNVVSIYTEVHTTQKNNKSFSETLADTIVDHNSDAERNLYFEDGWNKIRSYCNQKQLKYFEHVVVNGKTQTEVAKLFNTTQATVRNNIIPVYEKIRNNMSACEVSELLGIYK